MKQSYLLMLFATLLTSVLAIAAVNMLLDPFRIYHAPILPFDYSRIERYATAGLVNEAFFRGRDKNAIVIGSSLSDNTDVHQVAELFGVAPLKATLAGSSAAEQMVVLRRALSSGRIHTVFWDVRHLYWDGQRDELNNPKMLAKEPNKYFPAYLYDGNWLNDYPLLVSLDSISRFAQIIDETGLNDRRTGWGYWNRAKVQKQIAHWMSDDMEREIIAQYRNKPACTVSNRNINALQDRVFDMLSANKHVTFYLFVPPYHVSTYLTKACDYRAELAAQKRFLERIAPLENVRFYSFSADDITTQRGMYKDRMHYLPATNRYMYQTMADTPSYPALANFDGYAKRVDENVAAYRAYLDKRESELVKP